MDLVSCSAWRRNGRGGRGLAGTELGLGRLRVGELREWRDWILEGGSLLFGFWQRLAVLRSVSLVAPCVSGLAVCLCLRLAVSLSRCLHGLHRTAE